MKKSVYLLIALFLVLGFCVGQVGGLSKAFAAEYPLTDTFPQDLVLRGAFYTTYSSSSEERKYNVKLAAEKIDGTFIDRGCQFSFNGVVGERTKSSGFKSATIINKGEFAEGVGGGVCQVATTLYNAALMANLKILEYHRHSLTVNYVMPSFDAMVSYGSADLRIKNDTKNPILIKAKANGETIRVEIYGEKNKYRVIRESRTIEKILPGKAQVISDDRLTYPELKEGERMFITYPREGLKSVGYLSIYEGDKLISRRAIRHDEYKAVTAVIVEGRAKKEEP